MSEQNIIKIFKGDDTDWNGENLLTFHISTSSPNIDLSTMTARLFVGKLIFDDISLADDASFEINFTHEQTREMPFGITKGVLQILDDEGRIRTVTDNIFFEVTCKPFAEQSGIIDVSIPDGSNISISLQVGTQYATRQALQDHDESATAHPNLWYEHEQAEASDTWIIEHNLNRHPSVSVVDSSSNIVVGDVTYVGKNALIIKFNAAFKGTAFLN